MSSRPTCRTPAVASKGRSKTRGPQHAPTSWLVLYHPEAVREFEEFKDRRVRRSILTVVSILTQVGPNAVEPHSKNVEKIA